MLDRRRLTPLPMPSDVIERIDIVAKASQAGIETVTLTRNPILTHTTTLMMHHQMTMMMLTMTMTMSISSQEQIRTTWTIRITQTLMPKKPMKTTMTALAPAMTSTALYRVGN
jgi:hypothetical protein